MHNISSATAETTTFVSSNLSALILSKSIASINACVRPDNFSSFSAASSVISVLDIIGEGL